MKPICGSDRTGGRRTDADSLYKAARNRAITATIAKAPEADPRAPELSKNEADVAMDWLKRAVAAGYRNLKNLKEDNDLDILRDRDDFNKLLAQLDAKAAGEKKEEKK